MNPNPKTQGRFFRRLSLTTLVSVYLLILVGGIVRSTGSGMGCPDWPKCFGSLVPPTHISQLPENYKDIYAEQRKEKNERVVGYLTSLGFNKTADKIANDESILVEEDFNATKTWIEYVNRLIGAVIGLFILGTFISSFTFRKSDPLIIGLSFLTLILVGFQGWIGSIVVSTNLLPGMISVHMLLALLIVSILLYTVFRTRNHKELQFKGLSNVKILLLLGLVLMGIQIVLGSQVREDVDMVSTLLGESARADWVANLGSSFYIHRSFSLLILLLHVFIGYRIYKSTNKSEPVFVNAVILLVLMGCEILFGAIMAYFAIPPFLQPLHLIFAMLIFGNQCYMYFSLNYKEEKRLVLA